MKRSRIVLILLACLVVIGGVTLFYFTRLPVENQNPFTKRVQNIVLTMDQEVAIGYASKAKITLDYDGLHPDQNFQKIIDIIGAKLIQKSMAKQTDYPFEFHLLNDADRKESFALPGGQIFITYGLFTALVNENGGVDHSKVASVLGHEIGHVLGRHSAERIQESAYWQQNHVQDSIAVPVHKMLHHVGHEQMLAHKATDDMESDTISVQCMLSAGYDPKAMLAVLPYMETRGRIPNMASISREVPNASSREGKIHQAIARYSK